jgi:diguanylate cyclase (GGDEF)-like protein
MLTASRTEASTDALTGLGNRRSLTRDLQHAAVQARAERPACLALFDLDGFKAYNDTYGHPAGDSLLVRLGSALREAVGTSATAYRWAVTSSACSPTRAGRTRRAARKGCGRAQ